MPVSITLDLSTVKLLSDADRESLAGGSLPGGSVWFRLVTQGDDRVRPSHRALHGTVWRVGDPEAPVPPMDHGCRCMVEYVAAPDSPAAAILPPAEALPVPPSQAYAEWLTGELAGWQGIAQAVRKLAPSDQLNAAIFRLRRSHPDWSETKLREYGELIVAASPEA